ncbi:hypothetical protein F3J29_09860 [Enterobacter sp. Cy-643]|uniref:hypothetical protein n=1 Tax=Enterobacter sp. Cy-643 TaxID=2608346 RepID=UPI001423D40E|nr:hypothetical protein [Enterobacter sp. Cy-643]NIF32443.1 hypothetical protein [Enterobacter sp. Cy-643]
MAKLQDCQFIEIKIDNKVISGSSEEQKYNKWMEGYSSGALRTYSGPDGTHFDGVPVSILVTKDTSSFYEHYLKRGYKTMTITIVERASDNLGADYELQRTVYSECKITSLSIAKHSQLNQLFMDFDFVFEGMVEVTFNVPNAKSDGLDKIGPVKYSIAEKTLK